MMHIAIIFIYAFVIIQAEVGAFKNNGKMCYDFNGGRTGVFLPLFAYYFFSEIVLSELCGDSSVVATCGF